VTNFLHDMRALGQKIENLGIEGVYLTSEFL